MPQKGSIHEQAPISEAIMTQLAQRIKNQQGMMLILDYGYWQGNGDTFQAIQNHQFVDVFHEPGCSDLTAHVAFKPLYDIAKQAELVVYPLMTQGYFLQSLGINERLKALTTMYKDQEDALKEQVARLIDNKQMGQLFKVLFVHSHSGE